jgi:hypothetical protein
MGYWRSHRFVKPTAFKDGDVTWVGSFCLFQQTSTKGYCPQPLLCVLKKASAEPVRIHELGFSLLNRLLRLVCANVLLPVHFAGGPKIYRSNSSEHGKKQILR